MPKIPKPRDEAAIETERVEFHITAYDLRRWRVAAAVEGLTLSDWIRRHGNAAVEPALELIDKLIDVAGAR